eukprot:TRINITY_DN6489_c0_g1_i6.p4 TRINITY_DN6489_c0_g1~~TRINITY_DN6489_c0_g1_i6.p4  ORF type:complete len:117 (-),score=46.16 TRINITY_DN6489_c0_g1_i6:101-451(-)
MAPQRSAGPAYRSPPKAKMQRMQGEAEAAEKAKEADPVIVKRGPDETAEDEAERVAKARLVEELRAQLVAAEKELTQEPASVAAKPEPADNEDDVMFRIVVETLANETAFDPMVID